MKRNGTILLLLAGAALVVAVAIQWHRRQLEWDELVASRTALEKQVLGVQERLTSLRAEHARTVRIHDSASSSDAGGEGLTDEERREKELRYKFSDIIARHGAEAPSPSPVGDLIAVAEGRRYTSELISDPSFAELYRSYWRVYRGLENASMIESLQLPPEVGAKLIELMVEREIAELRDRGGSPLLSRAYTSLNAEERAEWSRMMSQSAAAKESAEMEIRQLLGDAVYARFQEATLAARGSLVSTVTPVMMRLSYTDTPLTSAQIESLRMIERGIQAEAVIPGRNMSRIEKSTLYRARATQVLSPQQMLPFIRWQEEENAWQDQSTISSAGMAAALQKQVMDREVRVNETTATSPERAEKRE